MDPVLGTHGVVTLRSGHFIDIHGPSRRIGAHVMEQDPIANKQLRQVADRQDAVEAVMSWTEKTGNVTWRSGESLTFNQSRLDGNVVIKDSTEGLINSIIEVVNDVRVKGHRRVSSFRVSVIHHGNSIQVISNNGPVHNSGDQ